MNAAMVRARFAIDSGRHPGVQALQSTFFERATNLDDEQRRP
jgi:hypothetical protein